MLELVSVDSKQLHKKVYTPWYWNVSCVILYISDSTLCTGQSERFSYWGVGGLRATKIETTPLDRWKPPLFCNLHNLIDKEMMIF